MSHLQGDPRTRWSDDDVDFASDLDYLRSLLDDIEFELDLKGGTIPALPALAPKPAAPRPVWLDRKPRKRWRWLGHWLVWIVAFWATIGAAVWVSVPAHADPATDQAFLDVIGAQGIGYTSADNAIGAGHLVCAELYSGRTPLQVADQVRDVSGLSPNQSAYFVGASIAAFCADMMPKGVRV